MRDREMTEWTSVRLPYGAVGLMADVAAQLGITRSELMRRAVAAYLEQRAEAVAGRRS